MYPYIKIFDFSIPSYGLCLTVAILLCSFLYINKARNFGLKVEDLIIVTAISVGTGLLFGGVLYIIVTYSIEDLFYFIKNGDLSFIKNTGLVFFGGLIGGIIGAIISAKMLKIKIEVLEKCVVPYIPLGHSIGRIGCLMAGCCYGFEYNGFLAVKNSFHPENTYFPTQAVESALNIIIMLFLLLYTKKGRAKYNVLCTYLIMYSTIRFSLEFLRGDEIRGVYFDLSTAQWISIIIFLFVLLKIIFSPKQRKVLPKAK
ncbi:MAG: prolipoprotein diacylglyceryl transferase [Ruminococcaceae bacterium]|nr:prolipoprotein diacylglyceryl transferase [Oscillospiraceae bacterium]